MCPVRPQDGVLRQRSIRGQEDDVAAAGAFDARGRAIDADVVEDRGEGRQLGSCQLEWRMVDDVDGVDATRRQHPADLRHELGRGQVPRHRRTGEGVSDDQVIAIGRLVRHAQPAVPDDDAEFIRCRQAKLLTRHLDDQGVKLQDAVRRARPGGRHVPRQGEAASPKVQDGEGCRRGSEGIGHIAQQPGVGELEVARIIQVDEGMSQRVHAQQPLRTVRGDDLDADAEVGAFALAGLGRRDGPEHRTARDQQRQRGRR